MGPSVVTREPSLPPALVCFVPDARSLAHIARTKFPESTMTEAPTCASVAGSDIPSPELRWMRS